MYSPTAFRETDQAKLIAFMQAHPFAILVATLQGQPFAVHIPLVIVENEGQITLRGHVARANPIWQAFDDGEALAIFSGPHAYVSPTAYDARESVPTWNYIAVHAYGIPRAVHFHESAEPMREMLAEQVQTYEPSYAEQYASLPEHFRDGLMQGVVGFEMSVVRLEGKYKLNQNRSHNDQRNVAEALMRQGDAAACAIGDAMRQNLENQA